jgi:hypothetical protein
MKQACRDSSARRLHRPLDAGVQWTIARGDALTIATQHIELGRRLNRPLS